MKRLLFVLAACAVGVSAGCNRGTDGALRVEISTSDSPKLIADCFQVEVLKDGETLASTNVTLSASQRLYEVAVKQGSLPAAVTLRATAYAGDCASAGTRTLASRSDPQDATFPKSGISVVALTIGPPGTDLDFDQDGYVDAVKGGLDCNDHDANIRPNTAQACGVTVDTNCNGLVGCADPDCASQPACAHPPTRLVMNPSTASTQPAACSGVIAVETRDATALQPVAVPTHVSLTATAGVTLFSDAACASPITGLDLAANASSGSFHYKAAQVGVATVTAHADGFTDGTLTATVNPFAPTTLVFVAGPASVNAGDCSGDFTVELRDSLANATTTAADLQVELSSDQPTGVSYFAGSSCGTPLQAPPAVTITAGQSRATFRVTGNRAVAMTLTARTTTALTATRALTVGPAAPSRLAFTTGDPGVMVNTCSTGPVTLELRDQFDNPSPAVGSDFIVNLDARSAAFHFFALSDTSCGTPVTTVSIAAGTSSVSVRVYATTVASYVMHATSTLPEATQAASVANGPPISIVITPHTAITNAVAGAQCSPAGVRVQTLDSSGSPSAVTAPLAVAITTTGTGLTWFSDATCATGIGATATVPTGSTETTFYFKTNRAQTFDLTVTAFTSSTDTLAANVVSPGLPGKLVWDAPTARTISANGCSGAFQLHVEDAFGNVTSYSAPQTLNLTSAPGGVTFSTAITTCQGAGTTVPLGVGISAVTFYATSTVPNPAYALTATVGITSVSTGLSYATLRVDAGPPTQLVYTVVPPTSATAGACLDATVQLRDTWNNPSPVAALTAVSLTTAAGFDFFSGPGCGGVPTNSVDIAINASSVAFSMRGRLVGTYTLTATQGSLTATPLPVVAITFGATTALRVLNLGATHAAGSCVTNAAVQRVDQYGNPTSPGTPLTVTLAGTGGNLGFSSDPLSCATTTPSPNVVIPASASQVQFAVVGTLVTATATVTATVTTPSLTGNASFAITPDAAVRLVMSGGGSTATAGQCSGTVTVTSEDTYGNASNPASLATVGLVHNSVSVAFTFYRGASCVTGQEIPPGALTIPTTASSATFSFKPVKAPETVTVTASAAGFTPDPSHQWTVAVGPPSKLVWLTPPPATLDRFVCSGPITVQVQDIAGNVTSVGASSKPVNVLSSLAAAGAVFFSSTDCTAAGSAAPSLLINAGTSEVSFSMMVEGTGSTNVTVADPAGVNPLTATPPAAVLPGASQGVLAVTATATDVEYTFCQPLVVTRSLSAALWVKGATALTISVPDANNFTLHTDSACASLTTTSVSPVIADGASTVTVWARGHSGAPTAVTVTATDPNGGFANGTVVLNALPLVRRGTCNVADTSATSSCVVTPAIPANDISRTFLVFQATGNHNDATDSNVTCRLVSAGSVTVQCKRFGTAGLVSVSWQTVSWGKPFSSGGMSVQRFNGQLGDNSANPFDVAVTATSANAFLLFSSASVGGTNDAKDFATARLQPSASPVTARLANTIGWANAAGNTGGATGTLGFEYDLQVVELANTQVDRATITNQGTGTASTPALASRTVSRTMHLHSVRATSNNNTNDLCKRRYRGHTPTATGVTFTRGSGAGGSCTDANAAELAWERIELPAGSTVQAFDLTLSGAVFSLPAVQTIGQVAPDRTILLLSGQGPGGQASGETNVTGQDNLGFTNGIPVLVTPTSLDITRPAAQGGRQSDYTPFVVQFPP